MNSLERSYNYAAGITRASAKNFYYTFCFLPPERRQSIFAVYTYSRRLDDAVDSVEDDAVEPEAAARQLEHLRSLLSGQPPDDPLVPALQHTIERYDIPLKYFDELIAGMYMDLSERRYRTFEDLYRYCYRAASVVGLVSIEIFGHDGPRAHEPAEKLGIAMQLTNILRDVAEDWRRDRIYLPLEDLERFGYPESDLAAGRVNDAFRALMEFQVKRVREYFTLADDLFPLVHPESRYCPVLLKRFYSEILDCIERRGYDVFSRRPGLPLHRKLTMAAQTWIEARRARRHARSPAEN